MFIRIIQARHYGRGRNPAPATRGGMRAAEAAIRSL